VKRGSLGREESQRGGGGWPAQGLLAAQLSSA
jgi:hypothetical protein